MLTTVCALAAKRIIIIGLAAQVAVLAAAAVADKTEMIDLGTLGGNYSVAMAANNLGQVVGYSTTAAGYTHAFLWDNGRMVDLGVLSALPTGYEYSAAYGINDKGQVAGYSTKNGSVYTAVIWDHGKIIDLGGLDAGRASYAYAINAGGQVVGQAIAARDGVVHAVVWDGGAIYDLSSPGETASDVRAINDRAQVAGSTESSSTQGASSAAFLWERGVMTLLPTLGYRFHTVSGINNPGQITGIAQNPGYHPFLLDKGNFIDLANSDPNFVPRGVNSLGQVAGSVHRPAPFTTEAVLWENGVITRLGTLGGSYAGASSDASAITDSGFVVGRSTTGRAGDNQHAFLVKVK